MSTTLSLEDLEEIKDNNNNFLEHKECNITGCVNTNIKPYYRRSSFGDFRWTAYYCKECVSRFIKGTIIVELTEQELFTLKILC